MPGKEIELIDLSLLETKPEDREEDYSDIDNIPDVSSKIRKPRKKTLRQEQKFLAQLEEEMD